MPHFQNYRSKWIGSAWGRFAGNYFFKIVALTAEASLFSIFLFSKRNISATQCAKSSLHVSPSTLAISFPFRDLQLSWVGRSWYYSTHMSDPVVLAAIGITPPQVRLAYFLNKWNSVWRYYADGPPEVPKTWYMYKAVHRLFLSRYWNRFLAFFRLAAIASLWVTVYLNPPGNGSPNGTIYSREPIADI